MPLGSRRDSYSESVTAAFPLLNNSLSVHASVFVCLFVSNATVNERRKTDGLTVWRLLNMIRYDAIRNPSDLGSCSSADIIQLHAVDRN